MKHITPPEKLYEAPVPHHMKHITPPGKLYETPVPQHMKHMSPPDKLYEAPVPHHMKHISPPEKLYEAPVPHHMKHMSPPEKLYEAPVPHHMTHLSVPAKGYVPPSHMSHIVPPTKGYDKPNYAVCPHFTLQEKSECPHIKHQCWSPGVPDADCPHHGLCCFDGCNNICLAPGHHAGGFHVPSHNAHLVPGHHYVPSPGHEDSFHHRTLHAPDKVRVRPSVYKRVSESFVRTTSLHQTLSTI